MSNIKLKDLKVKIIHVDSPEQSISFEKRSQYVKEELIPNLVQIGLNPVIHKGIRGNDLDVVENVVSLGGEFFDIGLDWNTKTFPSKNAIALAIGNMRIWKEAVEEQTPILVFENDIQIPSSEINCSYTKDSIKLFLALSNEIAEDKILYLQSTCPWRHKQKYYPPEVLLDFTSNFYRIHPSWYDMSGAAAYLINPTAAQRMIDYCRSMPILPLDQLFTVAHKNNVFGYIIPKNYNQNFLLHPTIAFQHSTLG